MIIKSNKSLIVIIACLNLACISSLSIKRIGVLTSGGDCPSLNACIRAIVKTANAKNIEVYGLPRGFPGLIMNQDHPEAFLLDESFESVAMLSKGGSRLGGYVKSDFTEFVNMPLEERILKISKTLNKLEIDGIIATGGDGSFSSIAKLLQNNQENDIHIPFIGIPKTIDNDIPQTTYSLGFQSAVSVASNAIANIRDTAESHRRVIIAECMGRNAGFLTLHAGLAGGADAILLSEFPIDCKEFLEYVESIYRKNRCGVIAVSESVILSQNVKLGSAGETLSQFIGKSLDVDTRHVVLGHLQRGGSPNAFDQVLATTLGAHAVDFLCNGISNVFVKWDGEKVETVPLDNVKDVPSKRVKNDYPPLRAALSMGIYCGTII